MPPMRSGKLFGRGGSFNVRGAAARLAIAFVVVTVIAFLSGSVELVALVPEHVVHRLMLWQPLTYGFLETSTLGVIFGALIIWSMGAALEASWGSKRFLWVVVGTTFLAGVLTTLLGLIARPVFLSGYSGGTAMATVIWVAYGWSFGRMQTNFWGLPVTGNGLAWIGVGFVALNAVFARSVIPVIPDVFAILLTAAYVKLGSPRVLLLKLRHWRYQRTLKSRARHLNVISGDRNQGRGSDRYLQ